MDFDQVLEKVGGWNLYQIYTYVIIGFAATVPGAHNLAQVFTAGLPEHTCHVLGPPPEAAIQKLKNLTSPPRQDDVTKQDSCRLYNVNYSAIYNWSAALNTLTKLNFSGYNTSFCNKWIYDESVFETSIITQWDLVCGAAWRRATAQSIYFLGFLTGAIFFGWLSDRFGRKPAFLLSVVLLVAAGTATAFAPEYWSYVVFRALSGAAAAGMFTVGFILCMEVIDEHHRLWPGVLFQGWFATGYIGLAGVAYFVRRWRPLQLIISVPSVVFLACYWLLDESPRWLMLQGRHQEAHKIVRKIARMNKKPYPQQELALQEGALNNSHKYTIIDLLRPPRMRMRAINTFFNWFVNSLVYYGLSFGVSDLSGSPHLNLTISGLMEFPGYVLTILLMGRLGRRWALMGVMVFGGLASICSLAIPKHVVAAEISLSMLGKLAISGSFACIYVFMAELFPTVLRTTAVGAGSMHSRVGGIVAPLIAELRLLVWAPLPTIIFSASSISAGLLALLLPETLHQHLPETLKDGELFGTKKYKQHIIEKINSRSELQRMNQPSTE